MNKKKYFWFSSIVAVLIFLTPFLLYIHTFIPNDVENYNTIFGVIKGGEFGLAQVYVFMAFNKIVPLILLILLYITNKNWWSHVILIPIATYLFQLLNIVLGTAESVDEIEFIYIIPLIIIILTPLYYIRKNLAIYLNALDLKKEMDSVIKNSEK
ncbi:hypothetical protein [Lutibacter sp.]|uniref:hypothetical protein n=1 Tax=Lutibacter sp. TaxID=1925666 RepID=UPI00356155EF